MATRSITWRTAVNASQSSDGPALLVTISHEDIESFYLSSDPTERISTEPLRYGTRSRGQIYDFAIMSAEIPSDQENEVPRGALVIENIGSGISQVLRSIPQGTFALVTFEVVLVSRPDVIESEYRETRLISARYDANSVSLEVSRTPRFARPYPPLAMSKARYPGLYV